MAKRFLLPKEFRTVCNGVRSLSAFSPFTKNIANREEPRVAPLTFNHSIHSFIIRKESFLHSLRLYFSPRQSQQLHGVRIDL